MVEMCIRDRTYTALQTTTYSIVAGTILLMIFLPQAIPEVATAPPDQLWTLLYLGAIASTVPYFLWAKGMSIARKTSDVTNYCFVTPLISTLMGILLLNEIPNMGTLLGGVIILGGLVMFTLVNQKDQTPRLKTKT